MHVDPTAVFEAVRASKPGIVRASSLLSRDDARFE